jgi:hypothetical protein
MFSAHASQDWVWGVVGGVLGVIGLLTGFRWHKRTQGAVSGTDNSRGIPPATKEKRLVI